eukprot:gnl/TRDRNA2_/TRDRNA2_145809_c0_seq1.p1 gnl/TRDRNA2_/TRDRNA2_145809_c0~~gnl/TRDRNA2_/TRDRNA2_145809_c0_seq1.p1  ORF type:complete len:334 (+),score=47.61 gnl/TRDRNA2_/TRDRNA2_145809_c0_seq1:63-1064(+)
MGESTILDALDIPCQAILAKYFEHGYEDPKLWVGIFFALAGVLFLVHLILNGQAMRATDGYDYGDPTFLNYVEWGFFGVRIGVNLIMFNAYQYNINDKVPFYCQLYLPVIVVVIEKTFFWLSFRHNNWIDQPGNFLVNDPKQPGGHKPVTANSVYATFEAKKGLKLWTCFFSQTGLLLFYVCALQTKLKQEPPPYSSLYFLFSFILQEISAMTGVFGSDWDFLYWAFMYSNAGQVMIIHDDQNDAEIMTPTEMSIYLRLGMSWFFEMFGRALLIHTLPLFLMTSDDPIEYMLNSVATGFFINLSQRAESVYRIKLCPDGDFDDEDELTELQVA